MATVALPADVTFPSMVVWVLSTTNDVINMQVPMNTEPPTRDPRRVRRSERKKMKKEHAITFIAPNKAVSSISELPPATSLKYCGAKTARALLPVAFWKVNNRGPTKKRRRLAGSRSSRKEKPSRSARSACRPSWVSANSSRVFWLSPPRIHSIDFQASSLRFWVASQRIDSGSVKDRMNRAPPDTNWRPTGICHSRVVPEIEALCSTP